MLSNPKSPPSFGSTAETSTSSASRSRIALRYSARFRRWTTKRPGVDRVVQPRSSEFDSQVVKAAYSASLGWGLPCGGIARTLSLRSTRSHVAASAVTSSRFAESSFRGSFAGKGFRSLWHPTQYWFNQARYFAFSAAALTRPAFADAPAGAGAGVTACGPAFAEAPAGTRAGAD